MIKNNNYLLDDTTVVLGYTSTVWDKEVTIESATRIKSKAFKDLSYMEKITLPSSLECIEKASFENCNDLRIVKCLVEPEKSIAFQLGAFKNCQKLETVVFENKTDKDNLIEPKLKSGDKIIKDTNCELLITKVIVDSENQFDACPPIKIVLEKEKANGVCLLNKVVIEKDCFAGCSNLRVVFLLAKEVIIAEGAFLGCDKLTIVCAKDSDAERYAREHGIRFVNV